MDSPVLLLDLDRTLVDLQSFTDYAAALADVQALIGEWPDADVPETDWDRPTQACMSVLHSLLGDPRWNDVATAALTVRATMIGDATWDQEAAARAGAAFVGVPSTASGFAPGVPVARTFAEAVRLVVEE